MIFGYARVSTKEQNLDLQLDRLKEYGCERIYSEKTSAVKERPELKELLDHIRKEDVIVVTSFDRLARSHNQLVETVCLINEKGANLVSLKEKVDTKTPIGRFAFNLFASIAEFERELIVERTKAGLESARKKGRIGGRRKGLVTKEQINKANNVHKLSLKGEMSVREICELFDISKSTYYRYLKYKEDETKNKKS